MKNLENEAKSKAEGTNPCEFLCIHFKEFICIRLRDPVKFKLVSGGYCHFSPIIDPEVIELAKKLQRHRSNTSILIACGADNETGRASRGGLLRLD